MDCHDPHPAELKVVGEGGQEGRREEGDALVEELTCQQVQEQDSEYSCQGAGSPHGEDGRPEEDFQDPGGKERRERIPGPAGVEDIEVWTADEFERLCAHGRLVTGPRVWMLVQKQHSRGNCHNQYRRNGEALIQVLPNPNEPLLKPGLPALKPEHGHDQADEAPRPGVDGDLSLLNLRAVGHIESRDSAKE